MPWRSAALAPSVFLDLSSVIVVGFITVSTRLVLAEASAPPPGFHARLNRSGGADVGAGACDILPHRGVHARPFRRERVDVRAAERPGWVAALAAFLPIVGVVAAGGDARVVNTSSETSLHSRTFIVTTSAIAIGADARRNMGAPSSYQVITKDRNIHIVSSLFLQVETGWNGKLR